jgi:23S rRNA (uracil1939-C5)-methyltransferase
MIGEEHHCRDDETTVVLDVVAMSHGPDAVARHDGRVVFVPHAAPGDRVRARLVTVRTSYARAEIAHRCRPGPSYREPPCPWIAECGGCPWQQVTYSAQLEAKARNVREALARIAHVAARRELPIRAAPHEWQYRHRIRLHVGAGRALGFRRARSHTIVEIARCAIADPALSAVLTTARALVADLAAELATIDLVANGRGAVVVVASTGARVSERDAGTIARWLADTSAVAGLLLAGHGWERAWGDTTIAIRPVAGLPPILQRPRSFSQVNPEANRLLVETVVALAAPPTSVLDLFCGAGNLSLPLARGGGRVVGVERSATSVADARAAAAAARLDVRFEVAAAEHFLRQQGLAGAELVVLDPPRGGAAAVAEQLGRLRPARILYVSCDPATLARDVATLTRTGYAVDRVQAIDLFPQTEHVETVLEAVRG